MCVVNQKGLLSTGMDTSREQLPYKRIVPLDLWLVCKPFGKSITFLSFVFEYCEQRLILEPF